MKYLTVSFVLFSFAVLLSSCGEVSKIKQIKSPKSLSEHSKIFEKRVIKVTDSVYVAT
jgi:hypothetical protein